jgi:hypothetical protein
VIRTVGAALVAALTVAPTLQGQVPDSLIASGVRAYRNLDFDVAAGFLTRALSLIAARPDTARRAEALTYLGATEVYRQRPDTARALFRALVRLSPAYRIDRLIFPPEVTGVFDAARRATPAVAARLDPEQRFRTGAGGLSAALFGSTFHDVRVELQRADASLVRTLYAGPIADSLPVAWDGRSVDGATVPSGRYQLAIASLDAAGTAVRILRFPLEITTTRQDTIPLPAQPDERQLLPERKAAAGGVESLLGGLLVGIGVSLLPAAVGSDATLSGGRFAVGGVVAVAGVIGFFRTRGHRNVPENVAANASIRAAWRDARDAAAAENDRRRGTADIVVRVGPPQAIDREGS